MDIQDLHTEKNEAVSRMEQLNSKDNFTSEDKAEWDQLKATVDAKNAAIERAQTLQAEAADRAVRVDGKDEKQKEIKNFSFREMLNYTANPSSLSNDKRDFYAELNAKGTQQARNSGVTLQGNGFVVPQNILNAVSVTDEGDDVLFDQKGDFIEALRNRMVLSELGVRYLSGLQGDIRMPKQGKTAEFSWAGETSTKSATDTEYGQVTLAPKRGFAAVDFSNQMLAQESLGMENLIRDDIMSSVAHGVERTAIQGGGVNAPQGIMDVATEVTAEELYEAVVNLEAEVSGKNIRGEYSYLMDSQYRATAKQAPIDAGSGLRVWEQGGTVNGYKTGVTNAAPADQIIFGDFSQLIIGDFSGLEILVNPYSKSLQGVTTFVTNVYMGTAIRHDEAFAYYSKPAAV